MRSVKVISSLLLASGQIHVWLSERYPCATLVRGPCTWLSFFLCFSSISHDFSFYIWLCFLTLAVRLPIGWNQMPPLTKPRLITVCLVCRDKRTRCDKAKPTCQECRRRGTNCTYSTRSRNVQTGRVSRGAEETPKRSETSESDPQPSWYQEEITKNGSAMYDHASLETVFLPSDHLTLQRGSQIRNITKTFWGFVNNQVGQ